MDKVEQSYRYRIVDIGQELLNYSTEDGLVMDVKVEIQNVLKTLDDRTANRLGTLIHLLTLKYSTNVDETVENPVMNDNDTEEPRNKRQRTSDKYDHPERSNVTKLKMKEKLELILAITNDSSVYSYGDRKDCLNTFLKQVGMPIKNCLLNHFSQDKDRFLSKHAQAGGKLGLITDKFNHGKFNMLCCSGKGTSCSK